MYSNIFSSEIRQQNRTEQNRTEPLQGFLRSQNRTITKLISIAKQNLAKFISVV